MRIPQLVGMPPNTAISQESTASLCFVLARRVVRAFCTLPAAAVLLPGRLFPDEHHESWAADPVTNLDLDAGHATSSCILCICNGHFAQMANKGVSS